MPAVSLFVRANKTHNHGSKKCLPYITYFSPKKIFKKSIHLMGWILKNGALLPLKVLSVGMRLHDPLVT